MKRVEEARVKCRRMRLGGEESEGGLSGKRRRGGEETREGEGEKDGWGEKEVGEGGRILPVSFGVHRWLQRHN